MHGRLNSHEVASILGQVDTAARAQLPLAPALRAMSEEAPSRRTRRELIRLAERLEQGESLPDALRTVRTRLSPAIMLLAENELQFGRIDSVLHWTVEQARRSRELRRQLWLALIYPFVLMSVALMVAGFLLFAIVPQFAKIYEDFGTQLPGLTAVVINIARFGQQYWPVMLAVIVFLVILVLATSPLGRVGRWLVTQRWSGSIPVIGPLFRMAALSDFCHLLAVFVESELPLASSVLVAGESSDDKWLNHASSQWALDIDEGIAAELGALTSGFPSSLAHVFRDTVTPIGMAEALHGLGDIYAARTEVNSRLTSTIVEPFVMVLTVVGLGTLLVALFMPLFGMMHDLI